MPFLGLSWHLLADSDPGLAPEMHPNLTQKSRKHGPKITQLFDPIFNNCWACLGGHFEDKNARAGNRLAGSQIQDAHKTA